MPSIRGWPLALLKWAKRRSRKLDRPALAEVGDDARDDNENDRQRQKPGPPAVSRDEHIDLRCWIKAHREAAVYSSICLKQEKGDLIDASHHGAAQRRRT
jgi:hypothetical protein